MNKILTNLIKNYSNLYIDNESTVIKVSGEDAKKFLQGQLTNDVESLKDNFINASYCTHQGKVIVNMQIFSDDGDIFLLLSKSLSDYFLEKISKYILMSKVELIECKSSKTLWSIGDKAKNLINEFQINDPYSVKKINEFEYIINMSSEFINQCKYINLGDDNCELSYEIMSENQTCLIDLFDMRTRLKKDQIEKYLPQVLNSDKLQTVSYKKGCYTGQEVIARTHYLGNVKKHIYLIIVDCMIIDKKNVVNSDGESVGELVGDSFEFDGKLLSHCVIRDSVDFNDLYIEDKKLEILTMEDTV